MCSQTDQTRFLINCAPNPAQHSMLYTPLRFSNIAEGWGLNSSVTILITLGAKKLGPVFFSLYRQAVFLLLHRPPPQKISVTAHQTARRHKPKDPAYEPLLTYFPTTSIEQSPSGETNRYSASKKIPCILWDQKVHYRIHNSPPHVPVLSNIHPTHASTHFAKIHYPPIYAWVFQVALFPQVSPVCSSPLLHTCYMPRPSKAS